MQNIFGFLLTYYYLCTHKRKNDEKKYSYIRVGQRHQL